MARGAHGHGCTVLHRTSAMAFSSQGGSGELLGHSPALCAAAVPCPEPRWAGTQTQGHFLGSGTTGTHLPALQRRNADLNKHTKVPETGNVLFSGFHLAGFPESELYHSHTSLPAFLAISQCSIGTFFPLRYCYFTTGKGDFQSN